jgi:hypothetical protein
MTGIAAAAGLTLLSLCAFRLQAEVLPQLQEPFAPRRTVCYRTASPLKIDGRLDEAAWTAAAWSEPFVDIEGRIRPAPRLGTRVKMLWDDEFFYVAADMEEPDVWATLTERDSVIYHDNDFEVFIDPDGDTHDYYELEINALNTVWDLLLVRPYRDGGPALHAWDIAGLKTAVHVRGTINAPGDRDEGWSVEIAMPWKILKEAAADRRAPVAGEQWRVNFSRVEWQLEATHGRYEPRRNDKGEVLSENNWVWSPQGAVAMHMPERWAYVQFSGALAGTRVDPFVADPDEAVKWTLRRLYYSQAAFREKNRRYARTLGELNAAGLPLAGIQLHATDDLYVMSAASARGGMVYIRQDGRVWVVPRPH